MATVDLPDWCPRSPLFRPVSEAEHEAVRIAQRVLRVQPTGEMDNDTQAALRGFQKLLGLDARGFLDEKTAWQIDAFRWSA